jgi:hypothetical protein
MPQIVKPAAVGKRLELQASADKIAHVGLHWSATGAGA